MAVNAVMIQAKGKECVLDALPSKGGYVRSVQIFSSLVIATHVACMGIILLIVSGKKENPKPVYYMDFLNAVLFAHRSGFHTRFVYAMYMTAIVAVGIILAASRLSPDYYLEYAGFMVVV